MWGNVAIVHAGVCALVVGENVKVCVIENANIMVITIANVLFLFVCIFSFPHFFFLK
jgi:hypothetical protein